MNALGLLQAFAPMLLPALGMISRRKGTRFNRRNVGAGPPSGGAPAAGGLGIIQVDLATGVIQVDLATGIIQVEV